MFDSPILKSRNLWHFSEAPRAIIAIPLLFWGFALVIPDVTLGDSTEVDSDSESNSPSGLAVDRKTTLTLAAFRRHVANSQFDAAVEDFQRLQTSDQVLMVPSGDSGRTFVPVYRALFQSFFELPGRYRERIAQSAEIPASRSLMQIVAEFDYARVPHLIGQYAGTEASLQAHVLMARLHLGRGNTLGVRAWLAPLTQKNVDEPFRLTALSILESLPATAEAPRPEAIDAELGSQRGRIPDQLLWQYRPVLSQKVQKHLGVFMDVAKAANATPHTTWWGRTEGDTNYRRTLQGVSAIDLVSGEPRWQYPLEPQLDISLSNARIDGSVFGTGGTVVSAASGRFSTVERSALSNLFCRDNITGQIADDAERLYLVANLGAPVIPRTTSPGGFLSRTLSASFRGSQMIAIDKASGRRVWSSGARAFDDVSAASAKVWFVGVPTVFQNRLYSVVERNGEIRLACFTTRTGELLWSTQLAWPDQSIDKDPFRQTRSATPTVQHGIVWCSTTTGWTTCVDEITRTLLWASDVHGEQVVEPTPMPRGRPVVMTPSPSLLNGWATPAMVLAGDSLVVLPHESHEIFLLNSATGQSIRRIPMQPSSLLLHIDKTAVVTCEAASVVHRNTTDGEVRWSTELDAKELPTGPAVLQDGSLLISMTSGDIIRVQFTSGEISERSADVLPPLAWGQLTHVGAAGDLLFSTPDHLIRLSSSLSDAQPRKPIEIAVSLFEGKKWAEALSLAQSILVQKPGDAKAKEICFQCHIQLAAQDPDAHLPPLLGMKKSPSQQIQVHVLEVEGLLGQEEFQEAGDRLARILTLHAGLLTLAFPDSPEPQAVGKTATRISFHAWATVELNALLGRISDHESIVTQLEGATVSVLLGLNHPALLPAIHDRIHGGHSYEESVHLLRHAIQIKGRSSDDQPDGSGLAFRREAELLKQLVEKLQEVGTRQSLIDLLSVVVLESPPEFLVAVQELQVFGGREFHSSEAMRSRLRAERQRRFAQWSGGPYRAIPVARLRSSGRVEKTLSFAESDDLFLSRFRCTATTGEYGRLQFENTVEGNLGQWSVPGSFQLHGTYSFQSDILIRAGSVLLVKSYASITAVSVLDQRVLWSRTFPYVSMSASSAETRNFDRPALQRGQLPSQRLSSSFQVVGAGHGWVALTNGTEFSMIDVYSGRTRWSMKLPANTANVLASGTTVMLTFRDHSTARFHADDGRSFSTPDVVEKSTTPIRNVGNLFVYWKQTVGQHDPRLQWVDSATNEIVDEADLSEMEQFCFVDDTTLAGFNKQHQVQVINLRTRTSQRLSFTPAVTASKDSKTEDLPLWDPARMKLAADGLNFYLCNRKEATSPILRGPSNRQLMVFTGDLIALDRQTGEQQWVISNRDLMMSTIDQPGLSVMVLIKAAVAEVAGQPAGRSTFYGVSKTTGEQLFEQSLPTQSNLRTLSLHSRAVNTLDIGVQGLRVRVEEVTGSD